MNILNKIIILSVVFTLCNAENNQTIDDNVSYIDDMHKTVSETVLNWADILDTKVSSWLEDNNTDTSSRETNTTTVEFFETNIMRNETNTSVKSLDMHKTTTSNKTAVVKTDTVIHDINRTVSGVEEKVYAVDKFFQNDKYLNETENTYIRVRLQSFLQTKDSNDFDLKLRAQIPFSKSRKNLKIFVDDLTMENANDILQDPSNEDQGSPDIGIHYFAPIRKIKSRYSIGLSGIDPFVRARYNMPILANEWLIDTVQLFEYSTDDKFEEETNIYFDRSWGKKSLLRIHLHRSTHQETEGMDYFLSTQYYRATKKDAGYGLGQTFIGNTKYEYIVNNGGVLPETETFGGINNYVTTFSWRENIWRDWFYYEIRPSVSFERQYDYEPNYRALIFFDFYFGKHH
jgi:hypothetical protein